MNFEPRERIHIFLMFAIIPLFFAGCATSGRMSSINNRDGFKRESGAGLRKNEAEDIKPGYMQLARVLVDRKFYDIAMVQLKNAKKQHGKDPELFYLMGVCHREKKEDKEAVSQFKKAISINPEYACAYDGLGITYDMTGDRKMAEDAHEKAVAINPANAKFYNNLGFSYMAVGRMAEAVESFKKSIALRPDANCAVNNPGFAYGLLGMYEEAFSMFRKAASEAAACNNMGFIYQLNGDMDNAAKMYRKAIELNPRFSLARINLRKLSETTNMRDDKQ